MGTASHELCVSTTSAAGDVAPPGSRSRLMAGQALLITLLLGIATYWVLGRPPLVGIDDANITQVYAENLAHGHGYVYQVGGERVEGSTSFAWTLLNALAFLVSPYPELLSAALAFGLCAVAVFFALQLAEVLAQRLQVSVPVTNWVTAVAIAATPSLFAWEIWTLMDLVLWTALLMLFLRLLVGEVCSTDSRRARQLWLSVSAAGLVLTRPEGIALALWMLGCAALLSRLREQPGGARYRPYLAAAAAAVATFALLTVGRKLYFGYPFPNTFYAKVSSSPWRQLAGGLRYLAGYVSKTPYCVVYLGAWAGVLAVCASKSFGISSAARAAVALVAATILAVLGLYVGLGGDHFPLHRFYQPLSLLLPLPLALACAYAWPRVPAGLRHQPASKLALSFTASLFVLGSIGQLASTSQDLRLQFTTGLDGRELAEQLRKLRPRPTVGVVAAGGFTREYAGKVFDLMGLNWVAMAHADPVKTGSVRNHAGFSARVFWQARPDVLAFTGKRCNTGKAWGPDEFETSALKGLPSSAAFLAEYTPAKLGCYLAFARKDWLARVGPQEVLAPLPPSVAAPAKRRSF